MDSSILVIGAGAAGLSAASKLRRDGFANVKVYEARDRVGGRIFTRRRNHSSPILEFGAQWIHGQVDNPVYEICKAEKLLSGATDPLYEKFHHWHQLDEAQNEFAKQFVDFCRSIVEECGELSTKDCRPSRVDTPISLSEYLRAKVEAEWLNEEGDDEKKLLIEAVFDWFVRLQNELNGGDAERVSANKFGIYEECDGDPVVALGTDGYLGFLSILLRDIPAHSIHLGVEVTKIDYGTPHVRVASSLGEETFDFVICTVPLGVLKERRSELFWPPLPDYRLQTIEALGFGLCNKIYLEFSSQDVFWQRGDSFQVLWKDGRASRGRDWIYCISRFNSVDRHPNLLVAWVAGESSRSMESDSDEEVCRKCHRVLRMVLENENAPEPVGIERSTWYSDPFSRGSYTYISTACDKGDWESLLPSALAVPLDVGGRPVVCFAGEATSHHYFSTVHGAFESGQREALRILKYIQEQPIERSTNDDVVTGGETTPADAQVPKSEKEHTRLHSTVLIIGAGAAGLGSALRLAEAGTDFKVLEAQSEAGGRIRTHHYDGGCLELGAQWVHGEGDNPLYRFCTENDLLTDPTVDVSIEGKGLFFLPDGSEVPRETVDHAIGILDAVKEELASAKNHNVHECESLGFGSVGEMYRARFEETRPKGPAFDSEMKAIMDWYTKFEIVDNACKDIDGLSLSGFSHYVECPGAYYINFKNGYDSFTETVLRNLPGDSVQLSTPVKHVKWSRDSKMIEVVTENGSTHTCNHVIVTPSVKTLGQMDFQPALPPNKREAFSCFGFDTIDKIFLYWDEPFWMPDSLGLQILWPQYDDEFFELHGEFLRGIYGFEILNHARQYLLAWIGGEEAEMMETLPDDAIMDGCYALLKRFVGARFEVTRPTKVIRSSWGSNPYVRGAYSHRVLRFDSVSDPVGMLQQPVFDSTGEIPLLLFAGEATDPDYFSTVHGALRSGYREAQRILDLLESQEKERDGATEPCD